MEDYAAYLAEEARSNIAALHQFKLLYDTEHTAYHFFFEGEEDSLFFMPEARRKIGGKLAHIYDCGGKRNVIEVRDTIKSDGYDASFCLFFVDRDYDDLLDTQIAIDEQTYMTDYYSIENDISTIKSANILVEDVIHVSRADPEFKKIEASLIEAFREFYDAIRPLTAWILAAKASGCAPNLRNTTGLKGIIKMSGVNPMRTSEGFRAFKKNVVVNGRSPSISSILHWARLLPSIPPKLWVRGKYDMWFFQVALLAALEQTNKRRKDAGGRALRIPSSLRDGRIFEVLGGRVLPPASLEAFYETRLR